MIVLEKALQQHVAILGKTGAGKSYAARGIVEHLLDDEKRVCVVDPKGDWYGLRLSASGKSAGYPVVIFGGAHGDVPLGGHSGAAVAELVATGNRPAILDLSELTIADRTRLFMDFAAGLFRHNRGPLWLVIDEVHNFAPQGKVHDPDAGKMLHWANRLASEGRGKGITLIMASQRPQKVAKDTLTCAETLVAMRVVHNLDRAAMKEWMDGAGDPEKSRQVLASLAGMERGWAWVWSPEIGHFAQAKAPKIRTFDSMSPDSAGEASLKGWADVDLDDVRKRMADVVAQAEANDPKRLKARIVELERKLAEKPAAPPTLDLYVVKQSIAERDGEWRERVDRLRLGFVDAFNQFIPRSLQELARLCVDGLGTAPKICGGNGAVAIKKSAQIIPGNIPGATLPSPSRRPPADRSPIHSGGCWRMLESLVSRHPARFTEAQWATMSSLKRTGGTWSTYKSRLVTSGWVEREGDYWRASDAAVKEYGHVACARDRGDVISEWKSKLGSGPSRMIDALKDGPLSRDDLAEACDLTANAGTFSTYLSRLRSNGLVAVNGLMVELTEELVG